MCIRDRVQFVSDRRKMGKFAISLPVAALAWFVAGIIVILLSLIHI